MSISHRGETLSWRNPKPRLVPWGVCLKEINSERNFMSVEIAVSALSMPQSLDSLKLETPLTMHRVVFEISSVETWYKIMAEARVQFGKNWRAQPRVKRRLTSWRNTTLKVWFEVPDSTFATWCAVKLGVQAVGVANK